MAAISSVAPDNLCHAEAAIGITQSYYLSVSAALGSVQNADTLERSWHVHDVVSLGVSARRGPVLWSHVRDVTSRDCPVVAAHLTFEALDGSFVIDMSTTKSLRICQRTRGPAPESAEYAREMSRRAVRMVERRSVTSGRAAGHGTRCGRAVVG